jgi:hypothetical protein
MLGVVARDTVAEPHLFKQLFDHALQSWLISHCECTIAKTFVKPIITYVLCCSQYVMPTSMGTLPGWEAQATRHLVLPRIGPSQQGAA